jgi:hypothetical protein
MTAFAFAKEKSLGPATPRFRACKRTHPKILTLT